MARKPIEIIESNGAHWIGRRASTDKPERGYHFRIAGWKASAAMPQVIGFYAQSIDDARHMLSMDSGERA